MTLERSNLHIPIWPSMSLHTVGIKVLYRINMCHSIINLEGNLFLKPERKDWKPELRVNSAMHGLIYCMNIILRMN